MIGLYDKDYTKEPSDEDKKIFESIKKSQIIQEGKIPIRKTSTREYPKSIRHSLSDFPNNYLDSVDLQKKDELEIKINELSEILDSETTTERTILNFIKENRAYFIIASILKQFFNFGHHGAYLFPEFQLGNSSQCDYLILGKSSDGWHFVFIELEAPLNKITLKKGDLGEAFRKGISQTEDWNIWIECHFNSLVESFKKYKYNFHSLPDEFVYLDKSRIHYVVIAGRRRDFKDKTYRIRREYKRNSLLILHYDNLLDSARNIIGQITY